MRQLLTLARVGFLAKVSRTDTDSDTVGEEREGEPSTDPRTGSNS